MRERSLLALAAAFLCFLLSVPPPASAAQGDCSQPVSSGSEPSAADCLAILKAAVGSLTCTPECVCAPKGTLPANAADALLCLRAAVGQSVALECPCDGPTTTSSTTTTTTTPSNVETQLYPNACVKVSLRRAFAAPVTVYALGTIQLNIDLASLGDRDLDGREDVTAQITNALFETSSETFGDITVELVDPRIHPTLDRRSLGVIEEASNDTPDALDLPPYAEDGTAIATFNVFLEALISGPLAGGRAHHDIPIVLSGTFTNSPAAPQDLLVMQNTGNIPLLKDNDASFFSASIDAGDKATLELSSESCPIE